LANSWRFMDVFMRADMIVLALMPANTLVVALRRLNPCRTIRRYNEAFVKDETAHAEGRKFEQVIGAAGRNSGRKVALITEACLLAFTSTPAELSDAEAVDVAKRAIRRTLNIAVADLKLGLNTTKTVAATAPLIGCVGTIFGIFSAFGQFVSWTLFQA